ncbi:MAG: GlxA family transcriptional regulator [Verrucomicrobiales bacterium]|nr:GlxA family transcriptional regulator [Verrucomicrobiales bacterium]
MRFADANIAALSREEWSWTETEPVQIAFILLPKFHMMALTAAVEPMRVANLLTQRTLYRWSMYSLGEPEVAASNDMLVATKQSIYQCKSFDIAFVCASFYPETCDDPRFFSWLRRASREGRHIGAMDTGTIVLARAGLLKGIRVTANYTELAGLSEQCPDIVVTDHLFETNANITTCAGGTAPMDMMLCLVREQFGEQLADRVSSHIFHERIRTSEDSQIYWVRHHGLDISGELRLAIEIMEANTDTPLTIAEVATRAGSTVRRLQRLFRSNFNVTPANFYMRIRLERARQYLRHTQMSVLQVAVASGFCSQEHFARRFRDFFGRSPRQERVSNKRQNLTDMAPQRVSF